MIGDVEAEHFSPAGHGPADAAKAKNSQPLATYGRAQIHAAPQPFALAEKAFSLADPPWRHQDERHDKIGDVAGQHFRRMGHHHAAGLRGDHVRGIKPDAHGGDDLQLLQSVDQISVRAFHATGHNAANPRPNFIKQLIRIGRIDEIMQGEVFFQAVNHKGR